MKLTRLRLVGFKSFVEPTDLLFEPGLTGVVGPNGCGKSNLVEALRWVMGESSHKNMRASGMDEVIFAGSGTRPARNTAEVMLTVDNADRLAPAAFNDAETLEIARRIEREEGSTYRINGREVRARDVQLLFADAATGARSPALVRQGQISEIIAAQPRGRGRHRRAARPPSRGGAAAESRRGQSPARRRRAARDRRPGRQPQEAGPAGLALQERLGRDPAPRGAAVRDRLCRGARPGGIRRARSRPGPQRRRRRAGRAGERRDGAGGRGACAPGLARGRGRGGGGAAAPDPRQERARGGGAPRPRAPRG